MIVVIATLKVLPGQEELVERQMRMLVEYVRNEEPGTLTYLFHRAQGRRSDYVIYERYVDRDALTRHSNSGRLRQAFDVITPLLEEAPIVEMYEEVAGKR